MNSPPSAKDEPVCPYLRNERLKMIVWYCLIIVLYSSIGWQWRRRSTRITQTHNHSFKWNRKVARFYIHLNLFLIIFTRPDIYCCLDHNNRWVAGQRVPISSKHLSIQLLYTATGHIKRRCLSTCLHMPTNRSQVRLNDQEGKIEWGTGA